MKYVPRIFGLQFSRFAPRRRGASESGDEQVWSFGRSQSASPPQCPAPQPSALPEDLLESELFGHGNPQSSIFARTRGGTVHLAEVHHLPMRIQAQLNALLEQIVSNNSGYNNSFNFRLITSTTQSVSLVVSQTSGAVRLFKGGNIVLELHQTARRT